MSGQQGFWVIGIENFMGREEASEGRPFRKAIPGKFNSEMTTILLIDRSTFVIEFL